MPEPIDDLPRSLLGYDREEVELRLAAERHRLRLAEVEAERLGAKLDDRDRRLQQALEELDAARREAAEKGKARSRLDELRQSADFAGADPEEGGIARALEEVYAEMWRGVGRFGDRAAERGGRLVARALTLSGLMDPRGGTDRSSIAPVRGEAAQSEEMRGAMELDVGPLRDFAQLTAFEDAVRAIAGDGKLEVKKFSGGRATIAVELAGPIDIAKELASADLEFTLRESGPDRLVLDLDAGTEAAA